ncbi:MAG: hypothetical protein RL441_318 [Actinomycetota bacterium]
MTNQEIANEWADGNRPAPAEDVAPEANAEVNNAADDATDNATDAPTRKSWNKMLLAGVAAAVLVAGGAGYAIGTAFNDHPADSFLEERGEHFGPDGQFGPGGQHPPRPGDQDLNGNGIEDHHEINGGDDDLNDSDDLAGGDDLSGSNA